MARIVAVADASTRSPRTGRIRRRTNLLRGGDDHQACRHALRREGGHRFLRAYEAGRSPAPTSARAGALPAAATR